ncbi:Eco57I restriction-modification methylase domain-containing protein [Gimesia sp.]|uniref:Eco57I restriction-modification methylase domain-containing protein n=1 Tax=Gimesia sp. TaxID=2024833 RepID=UPI003A8D2B3E
MSIARHHAEWLSLVPVSGPFLSLPVLLEAFPQGLIAHDAEHARLLRLAYEEWDDSFQKKSFDPSVHDAWVKFVLTTTLEFDESVLAEGQAIPQTLHIEVPEHGELLKPDIVLNDPATKKARMLIKKYPRTQDLTSYVAGSRWKASPDTRMTDLLHATGVRLGLVTNGEHWMLVDAPKGETTGYASWYASLWREEKITLQAIRTLLSMTRFFGVSDDETIETLLTKSASNQQEVTEQLGLQVLRAVEVLIQSLDKADQDHGRELLEGVGEAVLYESALNVMMRLVFLFCAEERELIPTKPFPVYEQNYSVSVISKQLREIADQHGEELLERRYDAWPRLLSAFRVVYGGLAHDDVYMPAYGGRLFDPDRFPFLEGRVQKTSWNDTEATPLPVNNRTVLHLLEALQLLQVKLPGGGPAEARRLSFRALDIEQIGHVYEGLLDHTAKRAAEPMLGLIGKKEPEVALQLMEQEREKGDKSFFEFLKKECGSARKWEKYLDTELEDQQERRLRTACGNSEELFERVSPFAGLLRDDTFGYPVVIPKGSVFVTEGTDRRSSGTHYTPRSLTEPIVRYTLEPLVYVGPAEGKPKEMWKLKSAAELLDLKICDMACGSGAFLVQAARYMSERLMESWDAAKEEFPDVPGITPEGQPSTGKANESFIPDDPAECTTYAMRVVAQRCLYGVDINPLAIEMAKLSLWLLTLAKDKPFEFLDHAIRCGDSLIGLHSIEQLRHFSLRPHDLDEPLFSGPWLDGVPEAIELRIKLEDMSSNTVEDVEAQEKLLKEAEDKITRLRCAADLLVAGEFWGEDVRDKQERVRHYANVCGHYVESGPTEEFEEKAEKERRGQKMFHWPLEFPEVIVKRGGFDAFFGNPPFMGGQKITNVISKNYRQHIVEHLALGQTGSADLCAYFVLRATSLLLSCGQAGLITTNTIAEGETRQVGLDQLELCGASLRSAFASKKWPGTASLYVSVIWFYRGNWDGSYLLDERTVSTITTTLSEHAELGTPHRLASNRGIAFKGTSLQGVGFLMTPEEANRIIESDSRYSEILFPYLGGADIARTIDCSPNRWAINFFDWTLEQAEKYPHCLEIVRVKVKPAREKAGIRNAIGARRAQFWWRYDAQAKPLYEAISDLSYVWIIAQTSKYAACARQRANIMFDQKAVVISFEWFSVFGVLTSSFHFAWTNQFGGTLGTTISYSVADVFGTFPFPFDISPIQRDYEEPSVLRELSVISSEYFSHRQSSMRERMEGLTSFLNRIHDPKDNSRDVCLCRKLQVRIDEEMGALYGWQDIELDHRFVQTSDGLRFTISEEARREVLHRLLMLNHQRYEEEVNQGLHDKNKKAKRTTKGKQKTKKKTTPIVAKTLFDMDGDDTTFPVNDSDKFLCGLLCDLVAAQSGLRLSAYLDALIIVLGFERHSKLLVGDDNIKLIELCRQVPNRQIQAPERLLWNDLIELLSLRKAIVKKDNKSLQCGEEWNSIREDYPHINGELISLVLKAASELRGLQESATPIPPEKEALLADHQQHQKTLVGGTA